ncbi:MAG: RsmD family RNA methyltransferase [Pyrinomonadaceae bacterium]|nr:RsmD family RNA methyltransferase [Pyrinomonadaceae bacterium]
MEVKKLTPRTSVARRPNESDAPKQANPTQQNRNFNGANAQKTAPFKRNDAKPFLKNAVKPKAKKELPPQPEIKITNDMQVTDGRLKGSQLVSTLSPKINPTARLIREKLFQTLGKRINLCRFLDLCAGSGAIGIEAISRGAALATFVERSAKMCYFIKKNLETCNVKDGHGEIVEIEIMPFLKRMSTRKLVWEFIYLDPPNNANYD